MCHVSSNGYHKILIVVFSCLAPSEFASHVSFFQFTGVDDMDNNSTIIGIVATIIILLFITIATVGVVIAILYRKKRMKRDCVEHINDRYESMSTEYSSSHETIPIKDSQNDEMQYNDAHGESTKQMEEMKKEEMLQ